MNIMLKLKIFLVALTLAMPIMLHSQDLNPRTRYEVGIEYIDVRLQPTSSSGLVGRVRKGDIVEVESIKSGWAEISYKGKTAYIQSDHLNFIEVVQPESKPEIVQVPQQIVQEEVKEEINEEIKPQKTHIKKKDKATSSSNKCDVFLSGRLGVGGTSFTWNDGPVSGKVGLSVDAVAQLYANEKSGYYGEAAFGYGFKGAARFPMHYLDLHLMPLGLYHSFNQLRLVGKLGMYTGFPVSKLRYTSKSNVDVGVSCGAALEYGKLSAGLAFDHGFVNVSSSPVKLYNWGIMFQITYKIISFE